MVVVVNEIAIGPMMTPPCPHHDHLAGRAAPKERGLPSTTIPGINRHWFNRGPVITQCRSKPDLSPQVEASPSPRPRSPLVARG